MRNNGQNQNQAFQRGPANNARGNRNQRENAEQPFVRPPCPKENFQNGKAKEIVVNQKLGEQGKHYLRDTFSTIPLHLNDRIDHPHGFGAFTRAHCEDMMLNLCSKTGKGLNIGANAARINRKRLDAIWRDAAWFAQPENAQYRREFEIDGRPFNNGAWVQPYLSDTCRSMCPRINTLDQVRRQNWTRAIVNDDKLIRYGVNEPRNVCWTCKGGHDTVKCDLCAQKVAYTMSSDSIYYPGVYEEHEMHAVEDDTPGYFTFIDYHSAIVEGYFEGDYWDSEGHWTFDRETGIVKVKVNGNAVDYEHGVLRTNGEDNWVIKTSLKENTFIYVQTLSKLNYGNVPIRTCVMTAVQDEGVGDFYSVNRSFPKIADFYIDNPKALFVTGRKILVPDGKRSKLSEREKFSYIRDPRIEKEDLVEKLISGVREQLLSRNEAIEYDKKSGNIELHRWRVNFTGCKTQLPVIKATARDVKFGLYRTLGATKTSAVMISYKKFALEARKAMDDPKSEMFVSDPLRQLLREKELVDAFQIADIISAQWATEVGQNHLWSKTKQLLQSTMEGVKGSSWAWIVSPAQIMWGAFLAIVLVMFVLLCCATQDIYRSIMVRAAGGEDDPEYYDMVMPMVAAAGLYLYKRTPLRKLSLKSKPFVRKGDCVRNENRLDRQNLEGRFDTELKLNDPSWPEDFSKITCNAKSKPGSIQLMPRFEYVGCQPPSVSHNCDKVVASAILRAGSNKATFDPIVMRQFEKFFRTQYIPKFLNGIDGFISVNFEEWLSEYPTAYQKNIRHVMEDPNWILKSNEAFKSFPKIELQMGEEPKEREISADSDVRKILANGIFKKMEKIAAKTIPGYCGSATYVEIGDKITEMYNETPNATLFTMDGSGFDMTQYPELRKLFNELCEAFVDDYNVVLDQPYDRDTFLRILDESLISKVLGANGAISYLNNGMKSGFGATTLCNTIMCSAYVNFAKNQGGIPEDRFRGLFKGDDVIGTVDRKWASALQNQIDRLYLRSNEAKAHGLGQICKFLKFGPPETQDFLSCDLMFDALGRIRLVNKPVNILTKISETTKFNYHLYRNDMKAWISDSLKACSRLNCTMREFYNELPIDERIELEFMTDAEKILMRHRFVESQLSLALDKIGSLKALMGDLKPWSSLIQMVVGICSIWGVENGANLDRSYNDSSKNIRGDSDDNSVYADYLYMKFGITQDDLDQFDYVCRNTVDPFAVIDLPFLSKFMEPDDVLNMYNDI